MNHPTPGHLNDFADELLPPAERAAVAQHLLVCDACRGRVAALRALASELAALPCELAPSRDLRPSAPAVMDASAPPVRGNVTAVTRAPGVHGRSGRRTAWLRAAAVVALLVGAAALGRVLTRSAGSDFALPAVQAPLPAATYAAADRDLRALVADRRGALTAEALRALDLNLASVDRAILELEAARVSDPRDADLARLLESQYRTRMELLRNAAALVAEGA